MGILFNYNRNLTILQEADDDKATDVSPLDKAINDYTTEADEKMEDVDESEDESGDDGGDAQDVEPTDYSTDVDTTDDESDDNSQDGYDNETPDNESKDPNDKQNISLMDDMVSLYYSIKATTNKLDNYTHMSVIGNKVIVQVKKNFSELLNIVYDYIVNEFKSASYAKNIYIYNAFIEAYKINIEMLKKIEIL